MEIVEARIGMSSSRPQVGEAEGVAAVPADVLGKRVAFGEESNPVPSDDADHRVTDFRQTFLGSKERVAAVARIFDQAVPASGAFDPVSEESAEVANLLCESRGGGVWVAVSPEQQGMAALDAHVFVIAPAIGQPFVSVMPEKTGQRMTDPRQRRCVLGEIGRAAAALTRRRRGGFEDMVVNVMAPDPAREASQQIGMIDSHDSNLLADLAAACARCACPAAGSRRLAAY